MFPWQRHTSPVINRHRFSVFSNFNAHQNSYLCTDTATWKGENEHPETLLFSLIIVCVVHHLSLKLGYQDDQPRIFVAARYNSTKKSPYNIRDHTSPTTEVGAPCFDVAKENETPHWFSAIAVAGTQ